MTILNFRYLLAGKISRVFLVVFLLQFIPVLGSFTAGEDAHASSSEITGDNKSSAPFNSPEQESRIYDLLEDHGGWMLTLECGFSANYPGDTGYVKSVQGCRQATIAGIEANRQEFESFFGKEYFGAFLRYQQDILDGLVKFLSKDFAGAKTSLVKARKDAEQMKRLPMKNKDIVSPLFADKMYLDTLIFLGVTECVRGDKKAGMASLQSARDEAGRVKWRWGEVYAVYCMGRCAAWADDHPTARALYQNALEIARNYRVHRYIHDCCNRLALMQVQDGSFESAISLLEEAVASVEFMRTKMEDDFRRVNFLGPMYPTYRLLAGALLETGKTQRALEVSENAKSRVLQDLLGSSGNLCLGGAGHDQLLWKEQTLTEIIEDLENTQGQGKEAETRLAAAQQAHDNVIAKIRQGNPDYGVLKVGGTADMGEIQALLDEKTVLLEYNFIDFGGVHLIAWLVTKDSIRAVKIPLDTQTLAQKIQAIRMMMDKPKSPAVNKLLAQFYELIIEPFDKEVEGKNLIFVPYSALHYLPFAALMDTRGKFLVEKHAIWSVPSSNVLKYCMARKKGKAKSILAFGNPDLQDIKLDLPNAQLEVKSIAERFPKPAPSFVLRSDPKANLPNAQREVQNIAEKFPQTDAYLRKEATETLAKKIMGNFDILHFACHGDMVTGWNSANSCLRLAPDETNDGKLTAGEIFNHKLNAQLVILSGCETGRGDLLGADEMVGLTRSFLYAGTPSLIVSLWKVDDNATSLLMTSFYKNLATMGKAEALRQAQIEALKVKRHPYYWAAFYLVGDGR